MGSNCSRDKCGSSFCGAGMLPPLTVKKGDGGQHDQEYLRQGTVKNTELIFQLRFTLSAEYSLHNDHAVGKGAPPAHGFVILEELYYAEETHRRCDTGHDDKH